MRRRQETAALGLRVALVGANQRESGSPSPAPDRRQREMRRRRAKNGAGISGIGQRAGGKLATHAGLRTSPIHSTSRGTPIKTHKTT